MVNIEPVICNGHLPYPWGRRWREGRVGFWRQRAGVGKAKRLGEGRVLKCHVHELTQRSY